jgi:hypothetical protein
MTFIERIIDASSRNPFLIFVLTILSVAGGYWALAHTPLDAIPDLSDTQVIISTDWERAIARPRRGPDHLPHLHPVHRRPRGQVCPRRVDVRKVLRLRDL